MLTTSVLALGAIGFNIVGWPVKVRFAEPALNYWSVVVFAALLPIFLIAVGFSARSKAVKVLCTIAAVCLLVPCGIFAFFAQIEARDIKKHGVDLSYILLSELPSGSSVMRLYRTDCGATCSYGLELRSEIDTAIGIKFVRPVWSKYRSERDAQLRAVSSQHIQVVEGRDVVSDVYR